MEENLTKENNQDTSLLSKADMKRARGHEALRRRRAARAILIIGGVAAAALLAGGSIWWARQQSANAPGETYPDQGQEHVPLDRAFSYNSNPPSSGPHYASPANWGVYDYEARDKLFIHNLEHGGVWISYKPSVDARVVEHLKSIVQEFGGSKLVMAPRLANDSDIAVAAWTRLLKINLVDGDITEEQLNQIRAFYRAYKNKGPEFVPDTMPGVDPKSVQ
ncbi:MAG: DUF3105 domain-containing protein [Patescibacteria group bacterium]